jgi:hypothetical protein
MGKALQYLPEEGETFMKACSLNDFMQELAPWLSGDYIREVYLDENGHVVLLFLDGVRNAYHIDDCTELQVKLMLEDLKKKGVPVKK